MSLKIDLHQKLDEHDSKVIEHLNVGSSRYVVLTPKQVPNSADQSNIVLQSENNENLAKSPQKDCSEGLEPEPQKKLKKENPGEDNQNTANIENQRLNDVLRSRKIHKQLLIRKSRWKPTDLELELLKRTFESNQYPTKKDKESILKLLEGKPNSKIELNQIDRWFQHQRERCAKLGESLVKKNSYKKFDQEELKYLQECFNKNTYPKLEEMIEISKKLSSSLSKIENWYKHNRRSLAKRGLFELKNKKYFKKDELDYLLQCFSLFPRPSKQKYAEMAKTLDCEETHIKNWYSNKRKKQKLIAKKNKLIQNLNPADQMAFHDGALSQPKGAYYTTLLKNSSPTNATQNYPGKALLDSNPTSQQVASNVTVGGGRTVPITTNGVFSTMTQGTIPLISNGAFPVSTIGNIPMTTNGGLPIITNGNMQFISDGVIPSGAIRLGANDAPTVNYLIPSSDGGVYSMIPNQGAPQGNLAYMNGARLINPEQGQFYQLNTRQPNRPSDVMSQASGSQISSSQQLGYTQPQFVNGQLAYPQMGAIMMPANNFVLQNGQIMQEPVRNSTLYVNPAPRTNENRSNVQNTPFRPFFTTDQAQMADYTAKTSSFHNPMSNSSSSNNGSSFSEASVQNGSIFTQGGNGAFMNKSTTPWQQTQTSTTESTNNNSNSDSSQSTKGHQRSQYNPTNVQQTNGVANGWTYPVNGNVQGGTMYIPVSQPPTSTQVNGQSQVSCYFSVLYPWQTVPNPNNGTTYQNNSYICNNSTTFSNYNNGFAPQPNVGFNSNIMIADFPMNAVNKSSPMHFAFGNNMMQNAPIGNLNPSNRQ